MRVMPRESGASRSRELGSHRSRLLDRPVSRAMTLVRGRRFEAAMVS
jgi:hypothetical protein